METVQSADGTSIIFDRSGDGPALILVVGAFSDRRSFRSLADVLSSTFTVYCYDRRGRGASGDTDFYAVEREVEDLEALVRRTGGRPSVFGHSSGAMLAIEAAAQGLPIAKLALYEPPYIVDDSRTRPLALADRTRRLISSGRRDEVVELFLLEATEMPPQAVAAVREGPIWPELAAIAHTIPYDLAICADHWMPADRLAKIRVPTLVLGGGESPAWYRSSTRAVAAALPDARHVSLEGQTHGATDDVLAPALVEFFSS